MRVLDWGKQRRSFNVVAFDPTGRTLAAGGNYQPTVVWDVVNGTERFRLDTSAYALQFHPLDGRLFTSTDTGLQVHDPNSTAPSGTVVGGSQYNVASPTFAPNEDWAVYVQRIEGRLPRLAAAVRFGEPDQKTLWEVGFGENGEPGHAFHLACLPGGERFLSAERVFGSSPSQLDRFAIRSRADGRLLDSTGNMTFGSGIMVYGSPWNDAIAVLQRTRFQVYRSEELAAPSRVIRNDKQRDFTGAAFHPSGRYFATTSTDQTVKLYDTATWDVARTFTWKVGQMRSIAFSTDGTLAAAGSDRGKVVVWDVDL